MIKLSREVTISPAAVPSMALVYAQRAEDDAQQHADAGFIGQHVFDDELGVIFSPPAALSAVKKTVKPNTV